MRLSDALARESHARPARILHGARSWSTVRLPSLVDTAESPGDVGGGADADQAVRAARLEARIAAAFRDGVVEGRRQVETEVETRERALGASLAARCDDLVADLGSGLEALRGRLADRVLSLSLTLAERIACAAIRHEPALLQAVVNESLTRLTVPWQHLDITVHPRDVPIMESWLNARGAADNGADAANSRQGSTIRLHANASLTPGGCRIQADDTLLDATLETRIARALDALGGPEPGGPEPGEHEQ